MTCREIAGLLPRFFDAELDSRQMRSVAMHSSRCPSCEQELRSLESLQGLVSRTVQSRVDAVDLSGFWSTLEAKLPARKLSRWQRLQNWWEDAAPRWDIRVPALAAAAMLAALAFYFLTQAPQPGTAPGTPQVAIAENNEATIDSLETEADSVAVMSDPETRTTILWVSDDYPLEDVAP